MDKFYRFGLFNSVEYNSVWGPLWKTQTGSTIPSGFNPKPAKKPMKKPTKGPVKRPAKGAKGAKASSKRTK